jgi:hypothetical protein
LISTYLQAISACFLLAALPTATHSRWATQWAHELGLEKAFSDAGGMLRTAPVRAARGNVVPGLR